MKYLKTKEGSLEEAISKAINEKPEQLKEEVIKEAFSKDIQDFITTGGIMSKVIKQARDVTPKELKDKKFLQKILKYWKSTSIDATTTGKKRLQALETGIKQMKEEVIAKDLLEAGGKYLKYSDLLLQKGRMMAKNKSTAMIDREIEKEKKRLGIKDEFDAQLQGMAEAVTEGDKEEYTKFFNAALKKFGVKSPADFKDDAKKKEFFNYVDKNYKGDHEEELDKEDKPTVKKVIDKLKKASKAHADQSKSLEKDLQDDVDKTIDTIQQANDSKRQSMRSILADIWKMNEGKSPFEKDEGFASDAQRRAAFASGYKAKGKKGKKEEIEKSDKTMTGKKPTKVEIEPQVK